MVDDVSFLFIPCVGLGIFSTECRGLVVAGCPMGGKLHFLPLSSHMIVACGVRYGLFGLFIWIKRWQYGTSLPVFAVCKAADLVTQTWCDKEHIDDEAVGNSSYFSKGFF